MRLVRLAAACCAVLGVASTAYAGVNVPPENPTGLRPFLLRVSELPLRSFSRTPSFAWKPVRNSAAYEFELSTSPSFNEGTVVWSSSSLRAPAASVPAALPWMTGNPYALWAHVRAISPTGAASDWSAPYGFNMSWASEDWRKNPKLPGQESPGIVQWKTVDGASAYDVWFVDVGKVIRTRTNAADEREYYTFHQSPQWTSSVRWRVRAVRKTYGKLPNLLPSVTYGPWSALQVSTNTPLQTGPLTSLAAVSDKRSTATATSGHRLTPGFVFGGNAALTGKSADLYRVYVFSDADCVNVVFKGAIVGSPAYAPRMTGPLALPADSVGVSLARNAYLRDGLEPATFMADRSRVRTTESDPPYANPATGVEPDPGSITPPAEATDPLPGTPTETGAPVDLWDSGYPNGRYYWTVVPVEWRVVPGLATYLSSASVAGATTIKVKSTTGFTVNGTVNVGTGSTLDNMVVASVTATTMTFTTPLKFAHAAAETVSTATPSVEYQDLELPQDACEAGRLQTFGKVSEPAVTSAGKPYVTGLDTRGRLVQSVARQQIFYGIPLAAWRPALGADQYQIQWSPSRYPWRPVDAKTNTRYERFTYATSTLLDRSVTGASGTTRAPLTPGTWYYRVRGIDFALPGTARAMSWSDPIGIRIARPTFAVGGK
jgi:hypothetical protein